MEKWKEEIIHAYNQGKTIQCNHDSTAWRDFVPHNQLDRPNVNYGTQGNWRIKPYESYESEVKEILEKSGAYSIPDMMKEKEKKYSKEEMLLFAGFFTGKRIMNTKLSVAEIWEDYVKLYDQDGKN